MYNLIDNISNINVSEFIILLKFLIAMNDLYLAYFYIEYIYILLYKSILLVKFEFL